MAFGCVSQAIEAHQASQRKAKQQTTFRPQLPFTLLFAHHIPRRDHARRSTSTYSHSLASEICQVAALLEAVARPLTPASAPPPPFHSPCPPAEEPSAFTSVPLQPDDLARTSTLPLVAHLTAHPSSSHPQAESGPGLAPAARRGGGRGRAELRSRRPFSGHSQGCPPLGLLSRCSVRSSSSSSTWIGSGTDLLSALRLIMCSQSLPFSPVLNVHLGSVPTSQSRALVRQVLHGPEHQD